jgi:hypothetical protein
MLQGFITAKHNADLSFDFPRVAIAILLIVLGSGLLSAFS